MTLNLGSASAYIPRRRAGTSSPCAPRVRMTSREQRCSYLSLPMVRNRERTVDGYGGCLFDPRGPKSLPRRLRKSGCVGSALLPPMATKSSDRAERVTPIGHRKMLRPLLILTFQIAFRKTLYSACRRERADNLK